MPLWAMRLHSQMCSFPKWRLPVLVALKSTAGLSTGIDATTGSRGDLAGLEHGSVGVRREEAVRSDGARIEVLNHQRGTLGAELIGRGGVARGGCDDAGHARADGGAQTHHRVLNHHAALARHAEPRARQVVDERVGLLLAHVVARHDDVKARKALGEDHRVHYLFKARARGGRADSHPHVGAVERLVHEAQHARPRLGGALHDLLVKDRLLVLQAVHQRALRFLALGRCAIYAAGPLGPLCVEVVFHLGLAAAHGVLQHVVVLDSPLDLLAAAQLKVEVLEAGVIRQAMQLLGLDDHAVAVEEKRKLGQRRHRPDLLQPGRVRGEGVGLALGHFGLGERVEVPVAPFELLDRRGEVRDAACVGAQPARHIGLKAHALAARRQLLDEARHLVGVLALHVAHGRTRVASAHQHEGADPDELLEH
mmetsp:Transcript_6944/g.20934  ORF Transcript_6944/g.20934 Transcript_6944/m.20934 type:complete len:423 (-) Transcript_6944:468-1736(-)